MLAGLLVALAPVGCERDSPTAASTAGGGATTDSRPNIVIISMDTTRADRLGCYGHHGGATPNIDRLAAEGLRFAQCVSPCPITLPAHATLFTGSYPFVHGARENTTYQLTPNNVTIAELAGLAGYRTFGVVGSTVLSRVTGIDQGFEQYVDLPAETSPDDEPLEDQTRRARDVTNEGLSFLDQAGDDPFFVFLHYYDPHWPFAAPAEFAERFDDEYLAEIAYTDAEIGRFRDALEAKRLRRQTFVILTSDHGEGRGDHGEDSHGYFVFDSTQHVPLIIWSPGAIAPGQVVQQQVRGIDVAPTVAALLGVPATPQMQGIDLLASNPNAGQLADLPAYAESQMPRALGYSQLRALRDGEWKYIHAPQPLLFHVAEDPGELTDLAAALPQRTAEMRSRLRGLIAESPDPPGSRAARHAISAERMQQLKALGYVGEDPEDEELAEQSASGDELDDFDPKGIDPHLRADEIRFYNKAGTLIGRKQFDLAAEVLARAVRLHPDSFVMWRQYADCLAEMQRPTETIEAYKRAFELGPEDAQLARKLARLLSGAGQRQQALDCLRKAVAASPDSAELNFDIGLVLKSSDRVDESIAYFEQAVRANPDHLQARMYLARAMEDSGRTDEAIEQYRQLTQLHPKAGGAYLAWSALQLRADRPAEAVTILSAGLEHMPGNPRLGEQLAWLLATCTDDAVRDGALAVRIAMQIRDQVKQPDAGLLDTLAAALAEAGEFEQAAELAGIAADAAGAAGQVALEDLVRQRMKLYEQGRAHRE
jgi:arylsulfatase A-like enzyme/Flp pilus assembly protein TadD